MYTNERTNLSVPLCLYSHHDKHFSRSRYHYSVCITVPATLPSHSLLIHCWRNKPHSSHPAALKSAFLHTRRFSDAYKCLSCATVFSFASPTLDWLSCIREFCWCRVGNFTCDMRQFQKTFLSFINFAYGWQCPTETVTIPPNMSKYFAPLWS